MGYFVDIHIAAPADATSAEGLTPVRLGPDFATLDDANAAAAAYITELGLPPGAAHYRVLDSDGREIVSTAESGR